MQSSAEGLASALRRWGIGVHPREWRIPPIETYPRFVAFVQTLGGKLVLFALFALLIKYIGGGVWLWMTAAAAVVSLAGRHRHLAALLCTGVLLGLFPQWFEYRAVHIVVRQESLSGMLNINYVRAATLLACVPLAVAVLWLARHYRDHALGRRPVLAAHLLLLGMLLLSASHLLQGIPQVLLWSLTAVFAAYFWFLGYGLIDQRRRQPAPMLLQLANLHPFFIGATTAPLGKGADNLRSVEAGTAQDLAVTQLKALKLIAWAFILSVVMWSFRHAVYGILGVTPIWLSFERFLREGVSPGPMGALSIIANFFEQLLHMAIWGHSIVAIARLAGFRLLRNTWRPLSSRTIAEFWNRYYYYFKELLVNFYFYPTYVRCFKKHPRLRIAFATFMAAGVGNWYFHFLLENYRIARDGFGDALMYMQTYAFYCLLLVGGIVVSQLRGWRPDPNAGWVRGRFMPSLGVGLFYCLLSFFDGPQRHAPLKEHLAFLFQVLGVY